MASTTKREKIQNRVKPCTCGCRGADSWHARAFKRVVKDVEDVEAGTRLRTRAYGDSLVLKVGRARFPFGERRVALVAVEYLDREALLERNEVVLHTYTRRDGTLATLGWAVVDEHEVVEHEGGY